MPNKKMTDVDIVSVLNDTDYLFVNQCQSIKQIKKSDVIRDVTIDNTLSVAGQVADAKATGDAINSLYEKNAELKEDISNLQDLGLIIKNGVVYDRWEEK